VCRVKQIDEVRDVDSKVVDQEASVVAVEISVVEAQKIEGYFVAKGFENPVLDRSSYTALRR
jgi:hypothetical protein